MGEALKNLMRYSRSGCIDDVHDIEDILKKFNDLTLEEVIDMTGDEDIMMPARAILEDEYELFLEDKEIMKFGFLELLFLIDKTELPVGTSCKNDSCGSCGSGLERKNLMRYLCMDFVIRLFLRAEKTCSLFRLFSAVNIEALFEYLNQKDHSRRRTGKTEERRFAEVMRTFDESITVLGFTIGDDSCIGDICSQAEEHRKQSWCPWKSLKEYGEQMLCACRMLDCLLIESFRYAYPEKFSMEYILGKYGSWFELSEEDGIDLDADLKIEEDGEWLLF